ncbi:N-acetyl-6-hydroxytryptophan oxidase ivoB [Psilocybe cubensis]|uniref:Tyrosinase copper-binding domain-containing protein n=2 Tax=Psilocybe cubensis TaxID=181762 RepID=A0A8H8CGD4_PSICU|nr:N-acetyl-6-hydroxytryptophan oxidase ivoB [Psilocybe cubensis]KAH9477723.1 N-acetyl-6-hydroxytryptophan oxidase ivoB [Psilocybe cubensis]
MKFSVLTSLLALATATYAAKCTNPLVRKEWRTLNPLEKFSYLAAVRCLQSIPAKSRSNIPGALSRFDDFSGTHILQTDNIHFVGHFQPWHRYFVATYEKALRQECGYFGAQPYWDWSLDATSPENFMKSPVFDSVLGFGGNGPYTEEGVVAAPFEIPGRTGGGCVRDGPFAHQRLHVGPGNSVAPNSYCLTRDFSPIIVMSALNTSVVNRVLSQPDFNNFDIVLQGGITLETFTVHAGGHLGVGGKFGTIADVYSSPGDPLFYLHHANLDRLWTKWQSANASRLTDISGPVSKFGPPFGDAPNSQNVTLNFGINLGKLAPAITVGDVMNTQGNTLCYKYAS